MTEEEFDTAFGQRLRTYAAGRQAPTDLGDRLVRSIRVRTRRTRFGILGLVLLVLAAGLAVLSLADTSTKPSHAEASLVAADTPRKDSSVTGWMFLGCIRECFRRSRNGRRREDEADTRPRDPAPAP